MRARAITIAAVGAALTALLVGVGAGVAHAGTGGTVQTFIGDPHGAPIDGVCLQIILNDHKAADTVVATTAPSGTDGMTGHITQANVPAGSYVGKFFNCGGAPIQFAPFYDGGTYNKDKATVFGVTDGATTALGFVDVPTTHVGALDATVTDAVNGGPATDVPVEVFSKGGSLLDSTCTDLDGFFASFNLPTNVGGVKVQLGVGLDCSGTGIYATTWIGGSSQSTATVFPITNGGDTSIPSAQAQPLQASGVTVSAVAFSGTSASPTITITGSGFKGRPSPKPTDRPCGEVDDPATGFDYGSLLTVWDLTAGWQAGLPGDCIGLVIDSYSTTQIVLHLGSFYHDPQYQPVGNGDRYAVRVRLTSSTGAVSGIS